MHGKLTDLAEKLAVILMDRYKLDTISIMRMTALMGVHTGPGIVGVAYRASE